MSNTTTVMPYKNDTVTEVAAPCMLGLTAAGEIDGDPGAPYPPCRHIETAIGTGVKSILDAFERKLEYDATKQLQIDRLHTEVQAHREGLAARTARPLVLGMIRLHDVIGKLLSSLRGRATSDLSPEKFFAMLEALQEDVGVILLHNGVAAYREPGGAFDQRRQRSLKTVVTSDPSLSGNVAETIRPGFEQGSEILEKERVSVYQLAPLAPSALSIESPESALADASLSTDQEQEG